MRSINTESTPWPKGDLRCKCRGSGMRTVAVHRRNVGAKDQIYSYATGCSKCALGQEYIGRGWLSVESAESHFFSTATYKAQVLAVYIDPTWEQENIFEGAPQTFKEKEPGPLAPLLKPGNGSSRTVGSGAGRGAGGYSDDPSTRYEQDDD